MCTACHARYMCTVCHAQCMCTAHHAQCTCNTYIVYPDGMHAHTVVYKSETAIIDA